MYESAEGEAIYTMTRRGRLCPVPFTFSLIGRRQKSRIKVKIDPKRSSLGGKGSKV